MKPTPTQLDELFTRRVDSIIGENELRQALQSGKKLRIKHGVDPTTPDLHLGYSVVYHKLREFQNLGHTVVFLIGNFTARFGDPSDRKLMRNLRHAKEVDQLAKNYLKQAFTILDPNKTEVRYNAEWYDKMSAEDLVKIMTHFTYSQMIERDMFQKRIKEKAEIGFHEPLYPILQGYDSVMIKSDITVIGTDQTFNEMRGRDLQRDFGQEPQGIMSVPLLVGTDGHNKMSQSLGNYIGITEGPSEQYGKIMSIPDNLIYPYFEMVTTVDRSTLNQIKKRLNDKTANPRDLKMELAHTIVEMYHGGSKADAAQKNFVRVFQQGGKPTDITEATITKDTPLLDFLVSQKLIPSKTEGRRLIEQRGIKVDDKPVTEIDFILKAKTAATIQVGKRKFIKVV